MKPPRLFIIVCFLKQKTPKEQLVLMTSDVKGLGISMQRIAKGTVAKGMVAKGTVAKGPSRSTAPRLSDIVWANA